TVGGAWAALKGRIGDAREDIVGAIFEGLDLGKTFDGMQAAVGRFLKSDTFKDFTERLKSGASYVKQIIKAMSVNGGTKEVMANMANVILAAFKRGGEIVAEKILSAFMPRKDARALWKNRGLIGAVMRGSLIGVAGHLLTKDADLNNQSGTDGQRELDAALNAFSQTVKENAKEYEQLNDRAEDEDDLARKSLESKDKRLEVSERTFLDEKAAAEKDKDVLDKKNKKAEAEEKLASLAEEIKSTEDAIYAAADREQSAREEIATAEEKRAEMLKQSISDWIAAQQEDEKGQETVEKQNAKDSKRADSLRGKQDRGVRLSERDRDWLNKFDRRNLELREGGPLNAEAMAANARDQQIAWQQNIEELQRKQTAVTEEIRDYLKEAVEVD
ncbi:MAG: hypothetical protein WC319_11150, partial [Candidatus Paceibacterota bacterium]